MQHSINYLTRLALICVLLVCSACSTPLFRANFSGSPLGPFSNGDTGSFEQGSSPQGDVVLGSNLEQSSVKFVNSFLPDAGTALLLGPNPVTATVSPTIEFRPVSADPDHTKRTFYWDGEKQGYQTMDCIFRDISDGDLMFTLRFANGKALLILSTDYDIQVGALPSSLPHQVWITLQPGANTGNLKISFAGGQPISSNGFFVPNYPSIGGAKITVSCSYAGFGSAVQESYQFDNLIFRSKK